MHKFSSQCTQFPAGSTIERSHTVHTHARHVMMVSAVTDIQRHRVRWKNLGAARAVVSQKTVYAVTIITGPTFEVMFYARLLLRNGWPGAKDRYHLVPFISRPYATVSP